WPTSAKPSPKTMSRSGVMADSVELEPHAAKSAADAHAAATKLRRNQFAAMEFSARNVGQSLTKAVVVGGSGRGRSGPREPVAHAFPVGCVGRCLHPDQPHPRVVEV